MASPSPRNAPASGSVRHLVVVLGDQLDPDSAAFDGFDAPRDAVWMAEVAEESTHVWSHPARIALFLSGMRHFRVALQARGWTVHYRSLEDPANAGTLAAELANALRTLRPARLILVEPGDWRVAQSLIQTAGTAGIPLDVRTDRHFLCSREQFATHVRGRKQLRLEYFYREMRRRTGLLMDGESPVGGAWNFDEDNRESFPRSGPGPIPSPVAFPPDALTREVLRLVAQRFADHPGSLAHFDWPVTPAEARVALTDFITHRLPAFGPYQDALWTSAGAAREAGTELPGLGGGRPDESRRDAYLYHSRLSAALNLKLLHPREVLDAAVGAYAAGRASLASVEGFVRQILGWREYVRGVYWHFMPGYAEHNALNAHEPLPPFYWTADTDLNCLRTVLRQTLDYGYAHHIQRLMVTGLFALLLGVEPREVHAWYLAVYVDAVEWVELPNTLGMSQHADGGLLASKPYIASGKYLQRMGNYCVGCRFDPAVSTGPKACPITTLYWDFIARHESLLARNPRLVMQVRNLARQGEVQRRAIQAQAEAMRAALRCGPRHAEAG